MEHLLNLLWMSVAGVLVAHVVRTHVRGKLRCSLPVAIGCAALIALALFPALSMTDDLQRTRLHGHHGQLLDIRVLDESEISDALLFVWPMLMLFPAALTVTGKIARRSSVLASPQTRGLRPLAVRPPPALRLVAAL